MCEGIALRKVESRREDARHQGGTAAGTSGVGGLFDVQMILEMRRRVMESDDDESDDDIDDDDDWD